jgi:ribosome maturation factor RimP
LFFEEVDMTSRRQQAETAAAKIARPILAELGLELVEATVTGPGRSPTLRLTADRPGGGVTLDELGNASRSIELALEVADVMQGRYSLEVSSPGLDRPWRTLEDFRRHLGEPAAIKLFGPLPDGRRHLKGRVSAVEGELVRIVPDDGEPADVPFANIASARPEVDWAALLRGGGKKTVPPGA